MPFSSIALRQAISPKDGFVAVHLLAKKRELREHFVLSKPRRQICHMSPPFEILFDQPRNLERVRRTAVPRTGRQRTAPSPSACRPAG
jgi:hypothetical protein